MFKKAFCLTATLSTAVALLLPIAPKIAQAAGCYILTPDGRWFDIGNMCQQYSPSNGAVMPQTQAVPPPTPTVQPPVQATNSVTVSTSNYRNQWGLNLDLHSYCQQKYGSDAALALLENNAMGWRCLLNNQPQEIAFTEACNLQYGSGAIAAVGNFQDVQSWHCRRLTNVPHYTSGS